MSVITYTTVPKPVSSFLQAFFQILFGFCWIVIVILLAQAAQAEEADFGPMLRAEIEVEGDTVTLGDLFEDAGEAADAREAT